MPTAPLAESQEIAMTRKMQIILAGVALFTLLLGWRWLSRSQIQAGDSNSALDTTGEVIAAVARVQRGTIENTLTIAGAFKPFQDVDVHAKVAGYIKKIYVDVGDHVKEGQILAVLEVPELAAQLTGAEAAVRRAQQEINRAQGDVQRAKSTHIAAHTMYDRLKQASEQRAGLVAEQEVDNAQAKDLEAEAEVSSAQAAFSGAQQNFEVAQANQKQFSAMSNYALITAPFAGVITARYADTGALVPAGTTPSAVSVPVVRLAQVSKLRLVLPIPESIAGQIHLGDPVKVRVQALNQDIVGKVSRFAGSLDSQTRTMETEIDFDNANGKLLPGMYTETLLQLTERKDTLLLPLEAVTQNNGDATVLTVNSQHIVEEKHVKLGLQGKSRVELLSGLNESEQVIIGNRSQFRSGQKVVPQEIKPADTAKGGPS
jgi:RND family efflux transporter MFP subunit